MDRGSDQARAVTAGIKRAERDKMMFNVKAFFSFVLAFVVGIIVGAAAHSFWWGFGSGFVVFAGLAALANKSYYRE